MDCFLSLAKLKEKIPWARSFKAEIQGIIEDYLEDIICTKITHIHAPLISVLSIAIARLFPAIREDGKSISHFLELFLLNLGTGFTVPICVVHQGPFPISFLDFILSGILVHSQNLVVIFPLILLQFQLCIF